MMLRLNKVSLFIYLKMTSIVVIDNNKTLMMVMYSIKKKIDKRLIEIHQRST